MIKVSVLMALNRFDKYTKESIDSILMQDFVDFEFIIVANNCTDDDFSLIKSCCDDIRIKLYRNNIPQLPYSLNFALNEAQGEFIARMDADDISLPERLSKQVEFLNKYKNINVVGSSYYTIDEDNNVTSKIDATTTPEKIFNKLPLGTQLCHPSVMIRRDYLLKMGGYCYGFFAEDYDLWLRIIQDNPYCIDNMSDYLIKYRVHSSQATNKKNVVKNKSYNYSLLLLNFIQTRRMKFLLGFIWINPFFTSTKDYIKSKLHR
ncbi:TPA: glycosyltransferase [Photobacterium damselae]